MRPLDRVFNLLAAQHPPCLSAGYQYVLQTLHGSHVLGGLEGSRIGAADLAHAALHLAHRLIFVIFHPLPNAVFDMTQMAAFFRAVTFLRDGQVRQELSQRC